jgi:hypothetical protein
VVPAPSDEPQVGPATPYFTGRESVRITDIEFADTTSVAALGRQFLAKLEEQQPLDHNYRKFLGSQLKDLKLLGSNITVVRASKIQDVPRLAQFLAKVTAPLGLLDEEDVDIITKDLADCVQNKSYLNYQVFPATSGSAALVGDFDYFARENYVIAACGDAENIELALVTGIYVANKKVVPYEIVGFFPKQHLKRYLRWTFAQSLAGQCTVGDASGRIDLHLA